MKSTIYKVLSWLAGETSAPATSANASYDQLLVKVSKAQKQWLEETEALRKENATLRQQLRCPFEPREVDAAPAWGQDDADRWRLFLTSETGERMARALNFWSQWEEQAATLRENNFENACGQAKGFRRCAQYALHKLSADIRPQQDDDTQGQHGAAALRERYAP